MVGCWQQRSILQVGSSVDILDDFFVDLDPDGAGLVRSELFAQARDVRRDQAVDVFDFVAAWHDAH